MPKIAWGLSFLVVPYSGVMWYNVHERHERDGST